MITSRIKHMDKVADVLLLFFTGAVVGWLYEVILSFCQYGTFVNRGVLHGPWLPIYGFGCILLVALHKYIGKQPFCFFVSSMVACGGLEYVTSWCAEMVYHKRWWDYSDCALNVNGRICFGGLIGFSVAGCIFVYLVLPMLRGVMSRQYIQRKKWYAGVLVGILALDVIVSLLSPNTGTGVTIGV